MNDSTPQPPDQRPIVGVGVVVLRESVGGPEVLLIRRGKPPRQGEWSIPGGKQEWGETLQDAAHREIMEETGVSIADLRLIDVVDGLMRDPTGVLQRHLSLVDYRAIWTGGTPRAGDDAMDARWVAVSDLGGYKLWSETTRVILAAVAMC